MEIPGATEGKTTKSRKSREKKKENPVRRVKSPTSKLISASISPPPKTLPKSPPFPTKFPSKTSQNTPKTKEKGRKSDEIVRCEKTTKKRRKSHKIDKKSGKRPLKSVEIAVKFINRVSRSLSPPILGSEVKESREKIVIFKPGNCVIGRDEGWDSELKPDFSTPLPLKASIFPLSLSIPPSNPPINDPFPSEETQIKALIREICGNEDSTLAKDLIKGYYDLKNEDNLLSHGSFNDFLPVSPPSLPEKPQKSDENEEILPNFEAKIDEIDSEMEIDELQIAENRSFSSIFSPKKADFELNEGWNVPKDSESLSIYASFLLNLCKSEWESGGIVTELTEILRKSRPVIPIHKYEEVEQYKDYEHLKTASSEIYPILFDSHQIFDRLLFDSVNESLFSFIFSSKFSTFPSKMPLNDTNFNYLEKYVCTELKKWNEWEIDGNEGKRREKRRVEEDLDWKETKIEEMTVVFELSEGLLTDLSLEVVNILKIE